MKTTLQELLLLTEAKKPKASKLDFDRVYSDLKKMPGTSNVHVEKTTKGFFKGQHAIHFVFKGNQFSILFNENVGKMDLIVQGNSQDLEVDQDLKDAADVIDSAKYVNKKWFKEYDPDYEG